MLGLASYCSNALCILGNISIFLYIKYIYIYCVYIDTHIDAHTHTHAHTLKYIYYNSIDQLSDKDIKGLLNGIYTYLK